MPEAGKDPHGDPEGQDTDEQFEDHPELAPTQGRLSVGKVKGLEEEARKRSLAGDVVDEAGDRQRKLDLDFGHDGKLGAETPDQERNREGILREEQESVGDWSAHPPEPQSQDNQARGTPRASLREGVGFSESHPQIPPNHKVWAAILKRLGGSSPGSEENLQLGALFSRVQFPTDQSGVLARLAPGAEFRLREGIVVDLHQAVRHGRARTFRNIGDLVDCVKDELRRMEADGLKVLKMA